MPLSTEEIVRETYRVALEENVRKGLRTQPEFDRYAAIVQEAAERIDAEKDTFRSDYNTRLVEAREVVLREQNARTLAHPKPDWAVNTPPSAEQIDIVARNRVQADHDARILTIRVDQTHQYEALRRDCHARENREAQAREVRQDHAKEAFATTQKLSPHEAQLRAPTQGRTGPSRS